MKSGLSNTNLHHLTYQEVHGQAVLRLARASTVSRESSHSRISAQIFLEVGGASFMAKVVLQA